MDVTDIVREIARALANNHLLHAGGADADTLVKGSPNWHFFTNDVRAALGALKDLPESPGPNYAAGRYSRDNIAAMVEDALGEEKLRSPN